MRTIHLSDNSMKVVLGNGLEFMISGRVMTPDGECRDYSVTDVVTELSPDSVSVERTWETADDRSYRLETDFRTDSLSDTPEIFAPAIMYRGNEEGKGSYPRLSISGSWSFLESRTAIPACVMLHDDSFSFMVSAIASDSQCSVSWNGTTITQTIPASERPFSYKGKNTLVPSIDTPYVGGTEFRKTFVVSLKKADSLLADYCSSAVDFSAALERCGKKRPMPLRHGWADVEALLLTRLLSLVEKADTGSGEYYLAMGRDNGEHQEIYDYTAASFLVKSLEGAFILASENSTQIKNDASPEVRDKLEKQESMISKRLGLDSGEDASGMYRRIACGIARFFLRAEHKPGVFQDCYDLKRGIWGGYLGIGENSQYNSLVNARCNGEAMTSYLQLMEAIPAMKDEVMPLVLRVADFYVRNQMSDGSFGRWWSPNGLGSNGAYILSFLLRLNDISPSERFRTAIKKSAGYYSKMALRGDFFGDTLDSDSCDKESGEALLSAMLDLWDYGFRETEYLDAAINAARFVSSWVFQDSIHFSPDTPMGKLGFDSRGMTSASIANQHLDFYGFLIAYDFLRLHRISGKPFFRKQAEMMLDACRQFICSPTQDLGSNQYGWQPEQFNHTDWDYYDMPGRTGIYSIDIAWVTVLSLGSLNKLKKEFPECVSH